MQLQLAGLPDKRYSTWSALAEMNENIPDMVSEYLSKASKKSLAVTAAQHLGLSV